MDNKEDKTAELLCFDVNINKIDEDESETLENEFDDPFLLKINKKNKSKKIRIFILLFIILLILIIIGLIIFIFYYFYLKKTSCVIGEEEKCQTCKENSKECFTCNPGYFIPDDEEKIKYECQKCSVANCSSCNGTKLENICSSCKYYLEPFYKNEKIVSCDYTCETGGKEKCETCSKENICSSCNKDYILSEGKCSYNYSFTATYYTDKKNQTIKLIGHPNIYKIIKMKIGEEIIMNPPSRYNFSLAGIHTVDIQIDISQITTFADFFGDVTNLKSITFYSFFFKDYIKDMSGFFSNCISLTSIDMSNFQSQNIITIDGMFKNCKNLTFFNMSSFNTENVISMKNLFKSCSSLTSIDFSIINTKNLVDMEGMFDGCSSLISLDLSNFNTEKVIHMNSLFKNCRALSSIDLSKFDTKNVKEMANMFYGCCNNITSLNLSHFNTKNVKDMSYMFTKCFSLISIDISKFETQNVVNMSFMFNDCRSLENINLS